ncbi:hypothetical protein B0H17DRAFT_1105209 [Mycena rosella]|uniref:ZZ-type domain-containing protein n=1 Tax=Mycena rosella TaxID=1033263 RepID=A0AAD7C8M7_MYCRO|nr:hypothetical protein B0H17DRAFT_1105209 [Mycena rosella]
MALTYFSCDGCSRSISSKDPRIRCIDCPDYDLCANCAVGERFSGGHIAAHGTLVFRVSGGGSQTAIASSTAIVYAGAGSLAAPPAASPVASPALSAHTPPVTVAESTPSPVPTPAASPPLPPPKRISMPPPLPARQQRPTSSASTLSAGGVSSYTMPPRDEAYSPAPTAPTPVQPPPSDVTGWGPFFLADLSPTPIFVHLMHTLFAYLDTGRTGFLVPEAYSHFLNDQGYVGEDNTWNANLIAGVGRSGKSKEQVADVALRRVFDLFSIEYTLRARSPNTPAGDGRMPLLTPAGFVEITSIDILCDPSAHWGNLSRVLRLYDLPALRAWGALPRTVLPEEADPRMLARVEKVTKFSREQGQRELAAARVKAQMQAIGEQNAIDLLDDRRYYYTYN